MGDAGEKPSHWNQEENKGTAHFNLTNILSNKEKSYIKDMIKITILYYVMQGF